MVFSSLLFSSCSLSEHSDKVVADNKDSSVQMQSTIITSSTDLITEDFLKMGVTEILVHNHNGGLNYSFETAKSFFLLGEDVNLSNYSVTYENDRYYLDGNDDMLNLSLRGGLPYVSIGGVELSGFGELLTTKDLPILLLIVNELRAPMAIKYSWEEWVLDSELKVGCDFWNTYYVYGIGANLGVSKSNAMRELNRLKQMSAYSDCYELEEMSTSCFWGDGHACLTTQGICCS